MAVKDPALLRCCAPLRRPFDGHFKAEGSVCFGVFRVEGDRTGALQPMVAVPSSDDRHSGAQPLPTTALLCVPAPHCCHVSLCRFAVNVSALNTVLCTDTVCVNLTFFSLFPVCVFVFGVFVSLLRLFV